MMMIYEEHDSGSKILLPLTTVKALWWTDTTVALPGIQTSLATILCLAYHVRII
jgi:hypothetical protein